MALLTVACLATALEDVYRGSQYSMVLAAVGCGGTQVGFGSRCTVRLWDFRWVGRFWFVLGNGEWGWLRLP